MSEKLLPCPFCGREPQTTSRASGSDESATGEVHFISCFCGGFTSRAWQMGDTREKTVAAWNTRDKTVVKELQETVAAFCDTVDRAIRYAETRNNPGMKVPFHGDFHEAYLHPSIFSKLRWWAQHLRSKL